MDLNMSLDERYKLSRYLYTGKITRSGSDEIAKQSLKIDEEAQALKTLFQQLGDDEIVNLIKTSSKTDGLPNEHPVLLALAVCVCCGKKDLSIKAYQSLSDLCKKPHTILQFIKYCETLKKKWSEASGWGRARRHAVQKWYTNKRPYDIAFDISRCPAMDSWSHRDLLRLCHIKAENPLSFQIVCTYIAQGYKQTVKRYKDAMATSDEDDALELMEFLNSINEVKTSTSAEDVAGQLSQCNLTWDHVPCKWHNNKEIWKHLLTTIPLNVLVPNLPRLHHIKLIERENLASKHVLQRIMDVESIAGSKLHPFFFLLYRHLYTGGSNSKKKQKWTPDSQISSALDAAFYSSIQNVVPTNKRISITVDASSSMKGNIVNGKHLTCATVAAAICLVFNRVEPNSVVKAFSKSLTDIDISKTDTVEAVRSKIEKVSLGGTDCARPMIQAKKDSEKVDTFIIITDGENKKTGRTTPNEALSQYRQKLRIPARLIVVALKSRIFKTDVTGDRGMLDICGFDPSMSGIVNNFILERF